MNKGLQGQRGAVLLVVLVVSLLSSLLVFTCIQENQLQTRLSGNFHKKINAQLSAEQGMNDSYRALHQALERGQVLPRLGAQFHDDGGLALRQIELG